jgi:hypothetical protein
MIVPDSSFVFSECTTNRPAEKVSLDKAGLRMAQAVSGGVVFSKLSKLLNQEDALGAPCLHSDFCSPQARPRGAQVGCGQA